LNAGGNKKKPDSRKRQNTSLRVQCDRNEGIYLFSIFNFNFDFAVKKSNDFLKNVQKILFEKSIHLLSRSFLQKRDNNLGNYEAS